jgi:hypothetical protein
MLVFLVPKANASESVPRIEYPTNGDCLVAIFQSPIGKNKSQNFLNAIQEKLEEGYIAKSGIKVSGRLPNGNQNIYIDLFKPDCGRISFSYWLLLSIAIAIVAILAFKFRGSFGSRVHSKV